MSVHCRKLVLVLVCPQMLQGRKTPTTVQVYSLDAFGWVDNPIALSAWGVCGHGTSRGRQMSRAPASCSGRLGNLKIVGSSLQPAALKAGRVKAMTLKLILVTS